MKIASSQFWNGKKVLLTGHTGFKGAWMSLWLSQMGAQVFGISLAPLGTPNLFTLADIGRNISNVFLDIRDAGRISNAVKKFEPDIILHLAAQALVRPSYRDPLTTFQTNIMGTANVLNAARDVDSIKVVVAVTTDKVYKNLEHGQPYYETDALGGHDPYSASKAASEILISSYKDSFLTEQGVAVASARAGNVIGGGDWSEGRLIPDAIRAWDSNLPLEIRRPNAVRPWQHVLEAINGYLVLAEKIFADPSFAGAYNFGPQTFEASTVQKVIETANEAYGRGNIIWSGGVEGPHEAELLSLDISKAKEMLGVFPRWSLKETIELTMKWYEQQRKGANIQLLCEADIAKFTNRSIP